MPRLISAALADLDRRFRRAARVGVGRGNRIFFRALEAATPVRSGEMRSTVHPTPVRSGPRRISARVVVGDPAAVHEEYGTDDQAPHPFIRPTFGAEAGAATGAVVRTLRNL